MGRRMTIIGLAALYAIALSAISASGASAGATAFACTEGSGTTNSICEVGSSGISGHVAIPANTSTTLLPTSFSIPILTGKIFGATVELESTTGVNCVSCTFENKEVGGVMEVTGTGGKLEFTGMKVRGAENICNVNNGVITTKPLKSTTTSVSGATLEPVTGTLLAEFEITGSKCTVAGSGIKLTGKAFASLNGAKATVNVTKASGELKLEGEKAAMTGVWTVRSGAPFGTFVALTTS